MRNRGEMVVQYAVFTVSEKAAGSIYCKMFFSTLIIESSVPAFSVLLELLLR
jgi:hypothetical protein